jgi:hypothetical protein
MLQLINVLAALVEFRTMGSSILLHQAAGPHVAMIGKHRWFSTHSRITVWFREFEIRAHKGAFNLCCRSLRFV